MDLALNAIQEFFTESEKLPIRREYWTQTPAALYEWPLETQFVVNFILSAGDSRAIAPCEKTLEEKNIQKLSYS